MSLLLSSQTYTLADDTYIAVAALAREFWRYENWGTVLSSAILLGFADSKKMTGT
jgi:hypothetical protein